MPVGLSTAFVGLFVGFVIGLAGVGGGALMTPAMVLLFGTAPHLAVGTDLMFVSVTKVFGTYVHWRSGTVDWQVVRRLSLGTLPAACLTLAWGKASKVFQPGGTLLIKAIAIALLVASMALLVRGHLQEMSRNQRLTHSERFKRLQPGLTVMAGVILGVAVTLTSIGAGVLGVVFLVSLYPLRMTPAKLVGTDLAAALPLAVVAGLGHWSLGNVDFRLLGSLLLGSVPGVILGSRISARGPSKVVRICVAATLAAIALKMLAS